MTGRKLWITSLLLIGVGILVLFFLSNGLWNTLTATDGKSSVVEPKISSLIELREKMTQAKVYNDPWEEWIDKQTFEVVKAFIENMPEGVYGTDAKKIRLWERVHAQNVEIAEALKKEYPHSSPDEIWNVVGSNFTTEPALIVHEGPQTPEALMETFDDWYSKQYPNAVSVDKTYPRKEWLQMILRKGYRIETNLDYSTALRTRYWIAEVANKPEEWISGSRGVPSTDDFETYKDAFIQRQFWQKQQVDLAEQADPDVSGGIFFDERPDVFLPAKKNRLYVYRNPEHPDSMKTWGEMMTEKQRFDLTYRGKHPEGWEVIYLDEDYNVLSEKPPHVTREMVRAAQLPPEDWTPPEDWVAPEGFEDYLRDRGWNGTWTQQPTTEAPAPQNWAVEAREAAETEWKQFEQMFQEFETFTNMSDTEKAAALQKRFTPQLPEHLTPEHLTEESIESALQKEWNPERIKKAEDLLNRYGPEEGLRRLAKDDPKLAEQVQRALADLEKSTDQTETSPPTADTQPPPEDAP